MAVMSFGLTWSAALFKEDEELLQDKRSKEHDTVMHQLQQPRCQKYSAMLAPHGLPHSALRGCHQVDGLAQLSLERLKQHLASTCLCAVSM